MENEKEFVISVDVFTPLGNKSALILSGKTLEELIGKFPSAIKASVLVADLIGMTPPEVLKKWTEEKEAEVNERIRKEKLN